MDNFGRTLKEIRMSKNMTLAELATGIVSVPFLSNFENGKTHISANNLFSLLDRLNITFTEFNERSTIYNDSYQRIFLRNFSKAVITDNIPLLNQLLDKESTYLKTDGNYRHAHNVVLVNQYINKITNLPYDAKQVKKISDYLNKVDDWSFYELTLFSNSLFFLPIEVMDLLSRSALKKGTIYSRLFETHHRLSQIIINIINRFLDEQEYSRLPSLFALAEKNLENTKFYYEKNKLIYLKGLYQIEIGQMEEGKCLAIQAIKMMGFLGDFELAKAHEDELKKYLT